MGVCQATASREFGPAASASGAGDRNLALSAGFVATVDEDAGLRRRDDEGGAPDLTIAADWESLPSPRRSWLVTVDLSTDALEVSRRSSRSC